VPPSGRARACPPDDAPAAAYEFHRDDAVENAGGGDVAELHLLDEPRGIEPDYRKTSRRVEGWLKSRIVSSRNTRARARAALPFTR
jgi:hypothetical protein